MTQLDTFKRFVFDIEASSYYGSWARSYTWELGMWKAYRDAVLAGRAPAAPVLGTHMGKALIDAGELYLARKPFTVYITEAA